MKWGIENDTCMILAWLSPVKCRGQKDATGMFGALFQTIISL
jgi:hypothetical protein